LLGFGCVARVDWPQFRHVHVRSHVLVPFMIVPMPHGFSGGIQLDLAGRRLLPLAVIVLLGKKEKRCKTKRCRNQIFLHGHFPRATNLANPKQTQKLPLGAGKELHRSLRVSMGREERPCNEFVIVL
jgi:hypothetical protein